jgi:hypothetical protein
LSAAQARRLKHRSKADQSQFAIHLVAPKKSDALWITHTPHVLMRISEANFPIHQPQRKYMIFNIYSKNTGVYIGDFCQIAYLVGG